jgi:hypothetical protein
MIDICVYNHPFKIFRNKENKGVKISVDFKYHHEKEHKKIHRDQGWVRISYLMWA